MATVTEPIILDSTGQDIKNSIDLLTANINRTASNIPYDNNLTIKGKIDAIDLSKGGTIKNTSGNTSLVIDGATSSNYGQLQLKRNGYAVRLTASSDLSDNRDISFPNARGGVSIESQYYGKSETGTSTDTYGTLIEKIRTNYFTDGYIRKNQIRFSALDSQANMIFTCQRFQNQNTSVWASTRGGSGGMVTLVMSFGSGSTAVRKYAFDTSGLTITDLTSTSASGVIVTIL